MKRNPDPLPLAPVAWVTGAFLLAALPHLAAMPQWLAGLIVAAAAWRLVAAHRCWPGPPRWVRVVLTVGAIFLVSVAYGGFWGRRTATALLCLMLGAKMLELYRVRDLRLVAAVSFFLIATQFLFNERLLYVTYLLAGSLAAICALISIQQIEDRPSAGASSSAPDALGIVRTATLMLVTALPVALVLFVTFPRLAQPLWGLPDQVMDGRTGVSDTMSPGKIASLAADDSTAFRAEFTQGPPARSERYWRGPVLWHFDGDTWHRSFLTFGQASVRVPPGADDYHYTVQLEPHEQHWMFALDYPVEAPEQAQVTLDHQIISQHPITALTRYRVASNPDFVDMPRLPPNLRRLALNLPEGRNPRTRAYAAELRRRHRDDRELIEAVLRWFRQENFHYSLEASLLGRHSADEFLFDFRIGYCEYYASAFAVLMRAAGIPARIVTGYQGGFWQSSGNYLLVRQSDAHAWVEVWLEGSGWTRVDPTAAVSPDRIARGAQSLNTGRQGLLDLAWVRDLRNRYDRLQHLWNRWVLDFDAKRQQRLMEWFGVPKASTMQIALVMIIGLAAVGFAVTLAWLKKPVRLRDPVQRAWYRLLRRLARQGLAKAPAETPLAFAVRTRGKLSNADELIDLALTYCRLHYGPEADVSLQEQFMRRATRFRPQRREPSAAAAV